MEAIVNTLNNIVLWINDNILWGIPMIVMIIGTGVFLTIRSRFMQVRKFGDSLRSTIAPTVRNIFKGKEGTSTRKEKSVSQFEAFSAAISGTVGTGNIIGVAGAMIAGGPGAVFWMWVSAFFGLFTNYSENLLGLYFRKREQKTGEFSGGPMYYIEHGVGSRTLAKIFSVCCMLAAIGMSMVQVNSISGTVQGLVSDDGISKTAAIITGIAVAALTALIIIGGIKQIGRVASLIVPFMALLFIVLAFVIIGSNVTAVPAAFALIVKSAFSFRAVGGGAIGCMMMVSMRYGCARGVFSNEAGLGSSVIAHSASETKEPVLQGLWGIFEVFFDTFVICTLTALSLICSGLYDFTNIETNSATLNKNIVARAAMGETFGQFGIIMFSVILPLFAFTTILAWSYYGQKAAEYLAPNRHKTAEIVFKSVYVVLIVVGAVVKSDFVWNLDDFFNAAMAIPNLIALILLSGTVIKVSKNYYERKAGKAVEPMFSAYPEMNEAWKKEK